MTLNNWISYQIPPDRNKRASVTDDCFEYGEIKMSIYRDEAVIDTDGTLVIWSFAYCFVSCNDMIMNKALCVVDHSHIMRTEVLWRVTELGNKGNCMRGTSQLWEFRLDCFFLNWWPTGESPKELHWGISVKVWRFSSPLYNLLKASSEVAAYFCLMDLCHQLKLFHSV